MDLVSIVGWLEQVTGIPFWVLVVGVIIATYALVYKYYSPHSLQASSSSEVKVAIDRLLAAINQNTTDINELKRFIQAESWRRADEDPIKVVGFGFLGERRVAVCQIPDLEAGYTQIYWPCSEDGALEKRELLEELAKLGRLPFKAAPGATSKTDLSVLPALEASPQEDPPEIKDLVPLEIHPLSNPKVGSNGNPVSLDNIDYLNKFDNQLKLAAERSAST